MSTRNLLLGFSVAALLGSGLTARCSAAVKNSVPGSALVRLDDDDKKEDAKKTEEKIAVDQLPQAVVDTVMKECPGGKITEAEKESKNDKSVYEMDVKVGADAYEVKTTLDGKFRSKKVDDDEDEHDAKK